MPRHTYSSEESEDEEDDSVEENKFYHPKPKISRIDKFKFLKRITINVSMTQYPIVSEIANSLGWRIQTSNDAGDWDIFWTDFSIDPDVLIRMHLFQKINHFPGIHVIARKNLLGTNLIKMAKKFPDEYNFFPCTWMLPQQYSEFRQYYETKQKGKARTYIVKPEADCQGRGIFLTRKISDIEVGKHYVVQRYLTKPLLLDGLKFDMRVYVLMCGTDPLKLYLYNEGLARLATEPYIDPSSSNLDRLCMHLTNYAINKNSPKFIFNKDTNNMGIGHKRALSFVYKQLEEGGLNTEEFKTKLKDVIIKTVISGLPLMAHQYKCSQPEDYSGNMCFHILGMDVMIDNKGDPFVIEVNHTPSFTADTPLDHKIKSNLIKDTLILMNINVKQKNELMNKCKEYASQRLITGKRHIFNGSDRKAMIKEAQMLREEYESKHLGGYEKIFPLEVNEKSKKYEDMIDASMLNYQRENQSNRNKIESKELNKPTKSQVKIIENSSLNNRTPNHVSVDSKLLNLQGEEEKSECFQPKENNLVLNHQTIPKMRYQNLSNCLSKKEINKKSIHFESEGNETLSIEKNNGARETIRRGISIDLLRKKICKVNSESDRFVEQEEKSASKRSTPISSIGSKKNFKAEALKEFPAIEYLSNTTISPEINSRKKVSDKVIILKNRLLLKSLTKPLKMNTIVEKEGKESREGRFSNLNFPRRSYEMPKLFCQNAEDKKKEVTLVTTGRRIQRTNQPFEINVNNG